MMPQKPKEHDDDDGRVIVNMDVEGMQHHDRRVRREKRAERAEKSGHETKMTKSEARRFTFYAVLAGLTIVLVFAIVWILMTLFATQVWFR